jgi:hypothetical protein
VGRQDDGHALLPKAADEAPHVAAKLDIDAGRRLVEEENAWLVRQRLGDHHAPLHSAGQGHDLAAALVPEGQVAQHALDMAGIGRSAEQSPAEAHGVPDGLEGVRREFLRHEPDQRARPARLGQDVVTLDEDAPSVGFTMPQMIEIRVVLPAPFGPRSAKISPRTDREVERLQCLKARRVGLLQTGDFDGRLHRMGIRRREAGGRPCPRCEPGQSPQRLVVCGSAPA